MYKRYVAHINAMHMAQPRSFLRLSGFPDLFGKVFLIIVKLWQLDFSTYLREQCKQNKFFKRHKRLLFLIQFFWNTN